MAYLKTFTLILTLAGMAPAEPVPFNTLLKRIEDRYNSTKTLKSEFQQTMNVAQGRRVSEGGILFLRKPGQMRWQYSQPEGKLFLTDGKYIHYVTPASKRVEISEMKETEDLRAPLAFLLGKLNFDRDFQRFEHSDVNGQTRIRAFPRSPKSMFEFVEFLAASDGRLTVVSVQGKDGSSMTYTFQNEQRNLSLEASLFLYQAPAGFEVVRLRGEP